MSPEQAQGEPLDSRSDLYALGLILYELVSLKKATPGRSPLDVLTNAAHGVKQPLTPASPREPLSANLQAIIAKATEVVPVNRYATAKELTDDLRRYLRGDAVKARQDTAMQKFGRAVVRNRQAAVVALVALALGAAAIMTSSVLYQRELAAQQREVATKEATKEERTHAERENQFILEVAQKTQQINAKLLQIEAIVEGFSQVATQAFGYGKESADPIYFDTAFANQALRPGGLVQSAHYGGPVSIDFPVWAVAPGVFKEALFPSMRRLSPIRSVMRESCLTRHAETGAGAAEVAQSGGPIQWCYIGLASGAVAIYPGSASVPEGYDPRTRPWYTLAAGKSRATWGNPYIDKLRGEKVLPCSVSFTSPSGELIGVAGVGLRFDYIINALSLDDSAGAIRETFLTDENARVIVRSSGAGIRTGAGKLHNSLVLEALPIPEVVEQIRQKKPRGKWLVDKATEPVLVAFHRINGLGWYHVVTARMSELQKQ